MLGEMFDRLTRAKGASKSNSNSNNSATYLQFTEYKLTKYIFIKDKKLKTDGFNMLYLIQFVVSCPGPERTK